MGLQDMAAALAARDAGMQSSAEHAEDVQPGWQDQAVSFCAMLASPLGDFTMERMAAAAYDLGLQRPDEGRAWGAVTVRLIREGIIEKTGQFAPAASSHGSPKPLYRRRGNV